MYAGLQGGKDCWCGNNYGEYGFVAKCNRRCSGDPKKMCGGIWTNSVYLAKGFSGGSSGGSTGKCCILLLISLYFYSHK